MNVPLSRITDFLDRLLAPPPGCRDGSNNGLQVEAGDGRVRRVLFGVDACRDLFGKAAETGAGLVVVHHGLSWNDHFKRLRGVTARRVQLLYRNGISLYASHLPLDAHPEVGNNARLAHLLGLRNPAPAFEYGGIPIGRLGEFPRPPSVDALRRRIERLLHTECRVFPGRADRIRTLGIVSGGGGDEIEAAAAAGCDAFLTGEVGHCQWHLIRETGLTVFAAGHYCTETVGLLAVMDSLAAAFPGLACEWADFPTGM